MTASRIIAQTFHWLGCFILYVTATLLAGGLVGAFLFLSIGALTHPDIPVIQRMSHGFVDGFLYAGVWAIGLSLVLCVMRAHREYQKSAQEKKNTEEVP